MTLYEPQNILSQKSGAVRELTDILSYCRPASSATEELVIDKYVMTLPNAEKDAYGNIFVHVGKKPNIAFSCHTDTVHTTQGTQSTVIQNGLIYLADHSKSNCLGADCGTGMWLMRQMVLSKTPGLYIFHRGEEVGCLGANYILDNSPEIVKGIDAMIAFDRKGYKSVITHQMGTETASNAFAKSLIRELNIADVVCDNGGSYTDSEVYRAIIPECTNVSVGYFGQHSQHEYQSIGFANLLLKQLQQVDWSRLVIAREPKDEPFYPSFGHNQVYSYYQPTRKTMERLVKDHPDVIADLLSEYGYDASGLEDEISFRLGGAWQ